MHSQSYSGFRVWEQEFLLQPWLWCPKHISDQCHGYVQNYQSSGFVRYAHAYCGSGSMVLEVFVQRPQKRTTLMTFVEREWLQCSVHSQAHSDSGSIMCFMGNHRAAVHKETIPPGSGMCREWGDVPGNVTVASAWMCAEVSPSP